MTGSTLLAADPRALDAAVERLERAARDHGISADRLTASLPGDRVWNGSAREAFQLQVQLDAERLRAVAAANAAGARAVRDYARELRAAQQQARAAQQTYQDAMKLYEQQGRTLQDLYDHQLEMLRSGRWSAQATTALLDQRRRTIALLQAATRARDAAQRRLDAAAERLAKSLAAATPPTSTVPRPAGPGTPAPGPTGTGRDAATTPPAGDATGPAAPEPASPEPERTVPAATPPRVAADAPGTDTQAPGDTAAPSSAPTQTFDGASTTPTVTGTETTVPAALPMQNTGGGEQYGPYPPLTDEQVTTAIDDLNHGRYAEAQPVIDQAKNLAQTHAPGMQAFAGRLARAMDAVADVNPADAEHPNGMDPETIQGLRTDSAAIRSGIEQTQQAVQAQAEQPDRAIKDATVTYVDADGNVRTRSVPDVTPAPGTGDTPLHEVAPALTPGRALTTQYEWVPPVKFRGTAMYFTVLITGWDSNDYLKVDFRAGPWWGGGESWRPHAEVWRSEGTPVPGVGASAGGVFYLKARKSPYAAMGAGRVGVNGVGQVYAWAGEALRVGPYAGTNFVDLLGGGVGTGDMLGTYAGRTGSARGGPLTAGGSANVGVDVTFSRAQLRAVRSAVETVLQNATADFLP